jgi:hypothetical protein
MKITAVETIRLREFGNLINGPWDVEIVDYH